MADQILWPKRKKTAFRPWRRCFRRGGQPSHWDLLLIGDFASVRYDFGHGMIFWGRSPCLRG